MGRSPFRFASGGLSPGGALVTVHLPTVPAGKRLVIEH